MKPIIKKTLPEAKWWLKSARGADFAYDFYSGKYMSRGVETYLGASVSEGRATDAYVLDGNGEYVLRGPNEPAQANGHGLHGFEEVTNILLSAQDFTNVAWNKTATTITPFFADSPLGPMTASRCEFTSETTSQLEQYVGTTLTNSLASILIRTNVGQVDTDITIFSSGNVSNRTVTSSWQRLFYLSASPTASQSNFRIAKRDTWGSAGTADLLIAGANLTDTSFLAPLIITTGTALTRDADDTRVIQGSGPTIAPGISDDPDELTFRVDWDGVAMDTGADRYLFEVANASSDRVGLFISTANELSLGADGTGVLQSIDAGSGFDDGDAHTAICYINQTTGELRMSVDGQATITGTFAGAVPASLNEMNINSRATSAADKANGTNTRIQVVEGDSFTEWVDAL